jgi:hypothetical protein
MLSSFVKAVLSRYHDTHGIQQLVSRTSCELLARFVRCTDEECLLSCESKAHICSSKQLENRLGSRSSGVILSMHFNIQSKAVSYLPSLRLDMSH